MEDFRNQQGTDNIIITVFGLLTPEEREIQRLAAARKGKLFGVFGVVERLGKFVAELSNTWDRTSD